MFLVMKYLSALTELFPVTIQNDEQCDLGWLYRVCVCV